MAFSLNDLAQELGIDVSTLKPESVSKWNGYLSEADKKYSDATAAQQAAKEALKEAQSQQAAIDEQIQKFGVTETSLAQLQASNAALKAALEEVKKQGLDINMPDLTVVKTEAPDPTKALEQNLRTGFSQMGAALRVQSKYQSVFGKPFTDDPVKLVDDALAAHMSVDDYAERKYKFSEESEKQSQAEIQRKIDEGIQSGVKKYQEEHPVTHGNPSLAHGVQSRYPKVFQPRNSEESKSFRNLSPRDRIAASVSRVREAMATSEG